MIGNFKNNTDFSEAAIDQRNQNRQKIVKKTIRTFIRLTVMSILTPNCLPNFRVTSYNAGPISKTGSNI